MAQLSLELPESLHQRLTAQAEQEGVSLNQYLLDLLARRAEPGYTVEVVPADARERQRVSYARFLEELGSASHEEIRAALDAREPGEAEQRLDQDLIAWLERNARPRSVTAA